MKVKVKNADKLKKGSSYKTTKPAPKKYKMKKGQRLA